MALVAPVVASFEWTIEAARELICKNHDDFEFVPNNRYERIWKTYPTNCFLIEGSLLLPFNVVGN
ncbi:10388_t:CDS:1, partial [Funneliformis geosporum]